MALIGAIRNTVRDVVSASLVGVLKRLDDIENRLKALEDRTESAAAPAETRSTARKTSAPPAKGPARGPGENSK